MKKIKNPWAHLADKGYNCFACAQGNPYGLKMEFYEDGEEIVSLWTPHNNYQSWLNTLHGGIQATLLDETGGWLIARKLQTTGMTTALNLKYRKPVTTEEENTIEIRAHIKEMKRNFALIDARIISNGEICTTAEITYYCFGKEIAEKDFMFSGCELEE